MVEVSSFKGITYNSKKLEKIENVMCPPYDIISDEMQKTLYEKDSLNFVRLILGKIYSDDDAENNRYSRAKRFFEKWINDQVLVQSDKPAIYPYKIKYKIKNEEKTMNGFFILLKLDRDYKLVKAHEKTLSKPKADRLNLMKACHANLEPIQLLYIDEDDKIRKKIDDSIEKPLIDVTGYDGFNHKLWVLDDENIISMVKESLNDKILFIADGHHRYQTAINYADEVNKNKEDINKDLPHNYRMVILANMFDEGLAILPTHRLIKKSDINFSDLIVKLKEFFDVEEYIVKEDISSKELSKEIKKKLETKDTHKFVLFSKKKYYLLTLKDEKSMDEFSKDKSKTWRTLDVSILHKIIIEKLMQIPQESIEDHVKYTRVDEEAIDFIKNGKFDYSFFMNATKIEELKAIADAGEHMPQKSTYFLPKMLSGLVMYKM